MPTSAEWLVCFAVPEEAAFFRKTAANRSDVRVIVTGMGRNNAVNALERELAICTPRLLATCGFAGGLDPALQGADVVYDADAGFPGLDRLAAAGAKAARFTCVNRVAVTREEKARLRTATEADVVEMESAPMRTLAHSKGIPSATVRVISDTAEEDLLLDFNALMTADMKLHFGKLAWEIMKSPGKIGALQQLQKRTRLAAERLDASLVALLGLNAR